VPELLVPWPDVAARATLTPPTTMTTAAGAATNHCLGDNKLIRNLRVRLTEMPARVSTAGPERGLHCGTKLNRQAPRQSGRLGWATTQAAPLVPERRLESQVSPDEFTEFYAASFRRLVGQLYAMTGDNAEAQDAVQEAFVRAWERRGKLDSHGSPEAWVRATAWRIAVSRWHHARLGGLLMRSRHAPAVAHGPSPDHVALIDALRKVPAEQRRAVVLYHLCDRTIAEIAAETDVPVGTVKARLARGRAALAPFLRESAVATGPNDSGRAVSGA
jgi:RNA polymerase sigma-70 factor, ECF subfamily